MALGKNLTLGDTVYFISTRYTHKRPAIVTDISPSGESRRISLHVFPPGGGDAPFVAAHVEHASLARPGVDAWDFLDSTATKEL